MVARSVSLLITAFVLLAGVPSRSFSQDDLVDNCSSWREGEVTASLMSGGSLPLGPDGFAGHWKFTFNLAAAIDYRLDDQWAVGAIVDYSPYNHTGRSLSHRNSEFPCISGGDRQLSSAGVRMKYYMTSGDRTEVYVAGTLGVVNINRTDAIYQSTNGPYVVPGVASVNLHSVLAAGIESVIAPGLSLTMEAGIGLVEDGFTLDSYLPARAGIRFTL